MLKSINLLIYLLPLFLLSQDDITPYLGEYHFGDSDSETSLYIIDYNDQLWAYEWGHQWNFETDRWAHWLQVYDQVKIENDQLVLDDFSHNVKIFKKDEICCWFKDEEEDRIYRYGCKIDEVEKDQPGKYPFASYLPLSLSLLETYSLKELRLMRNEIYARNGYQFKKDGEMDRYFQKQDWYVPKEQERFYLFIPDKYNVHQIQIVEKALKEGNLNEVKALEQKLKKFKKTVLNKKKYPDFHRDIPFLYQEAIHHLDLSELLLYGSFKKGFYFHQTFEGKEVEDYYNCADYFIFSLKENTLQLTFEVNDKTDKKDECRKSRKVYTFDILEEIVYRGYSVE